MRNPAAVKLTAKAQSPHPVNRRATQPKRQLPMSKYCKRKPHFSSYCCPFCTGGLGYYAPKYWVQRRVKARETEITSGFPDALDLMLVCVEAGQSLDQSIIRVAKEIRTGYPALSEEFEMVAFEMKAGKDKVRVLRDLSERVGVQDVTSFVTTLIQSATFGTSISEALRVYADEMRDKRVMRAEEKASTLPTKLTLGTMIFCLPPLLVILIGPSIYGVVMDLQRGM